MSSKLVPSCGFSVLKLVHRAQIIRSRRVSDAFLALRMLIESRALCCDAADLNEPTPPRVANRLRRVARDRRELRPLDKSAPGWLPRPTVPLRALDAYDSTRGPRCPPFIAIIKILVQLDCLTAQPPLVHHIPCTPSFVPSCRFNAAFRLSNVLQHVL
jgi:hypothetical protein